MKRRHHPILIVICLLALCTSACSKRQRQSDQTVTSTSPPAAGPTGEFDTMPGAAGVPVVGRDIPLDGDLVEMGRYFEPGAYRRASGGDGTEPSALGGDADTAAGSDGELITNLFRRIHFEFDSYRLSDEGRRILQNIGLHLVENEEMKVVIEGHCDERGSDTYNMALGEKRALSVREFLVAMGVAANRLHTVSYGEESLLDRADTTEAHRRNRRAEFRIAIQ